MRRVFHLRTVDLDELLPLSALAAVDAAAHARAIAKYDDSPERRRLPGTAIPHTDATWSDVVFLSPVHPHATWLAWHEITGRDLPGQEFWSIPVAALPDPTVVLDRTLTRTGDPIDPREVTRFDREAFRTSTTLPEANRAWLAAVAASGRRGGWFHRVPHVLTVGAVPLADAEVVDWRTPPG